MLLSDAINFYINNPNESHQLKQELFRELAPNIQMYLISALDYGRYLFDQRNDLSGVRSFDKNNANYLIQDQLNDAMSKYLLSNQFNTYLFNFREYCQVSRIHMDAL
jgi:hypothetical protein